MLTLVDQTLHYLTTRHFANILLILLGRVLDESKRQTAFATQARVEVAWHSVATRHRANGGDDRTTYAFRSTEARVHITTNVFERDVHTETIAMMVKFHLPLDKHGREYPLAHLHRIGPTRTSGHHRISTGFANNKQIMYDTSSISNYFTIWMREIPTTGVDVDRQNLQEGSGKRKSTCDLLKIKKYIFLRV
ncbi:hypothetical protein HOY80DRAFT_1136254 [Tuber brumale]|nr:hypothetical protein HOY80DRAFT_1136254 [Tuber brumale]